MKIAVASDHAGFCLKGKVLEDLAGLGYNVGTSQNFRSRRLTGTER